VGGGIATRQTSNVCSGRQELERGQADVVNATESCGWWRVEAVEAWVEVSGSVDRIARLRNGKTRVGVPGAGMAHRGGAYMARYIIRPVARKTSGIDWCRGVEIGCRARVRVFGCFSVAGDES
jgi:hypothetical protein